MNRREIDNYLSEVSESLSFDPRFASDVCNEIEGHLSDALEASACTPEALSHTAPDSWASEQKRVHEHFGPPQLIAAQMSVSFILRKLRDLLVWMLLTFAVGFCVAALNGTAAWICVAIATLCGAVAVACIYRCQAAPFSMEVSYRKLCLPMMLSSTTVFLLAASFLISAFTLAFHDHFNMRHWMVPAIDFSGFGIVTGRWIYHRRKTAMMCALWRYAEHSYAMRKSD